MPTPQTPNNPETLKVANPVPQAEGLRKITATPVEKLLFGLAPEDDFLVSRRPEDARAVTARLDVVKSYLKKNPALADAVNKEAADAWQKAKGDRSAYLTAIRSRRMEIQSRAELDFAAEQAPAIVANVRDSLARYLAEVEGAASPHL